MIENKLDVIEKLLKRTHNLPEVLSLDPAESGFIFEEQDKELLIQTYEEFDVILSDVVCFIIAKFSRKQECLYRWSRIDSRASDGDPTMSGEDLEFLRNAWRNRVCELTDLLNCLRNDEIFPSVIRSECTEENWKTILKKKRLTLLEGLLLIAGSGGLAGALFSFLE